MTNKKKFSLTLASATMAAAVAGSFLVAAPANAAQLRVLTPQQAGISGSWQKINEPYCFPSTRCVSGLWTSGPNSTWTYLFQAQRFRTVVEARKFDKAYSRSLELPAPITKTVVRGGVRVKVHQRNTNEFGLQRYVIAQYQKKAVTISVSGKNVPAPGVNKLVNLSIAKILAAGQIPLGKIRS